MPRIHPKKEAKDISKAIVKQMLVFSTGGFSLVAALAWNDAIRAFIDQFIKPYVSKGSGVLTQVIYALAITIIAVGITFQLGRLQQKLEENPEEKK